MEETKLLTDVESFLAQKPLYYKQIDYNRFPTIYNTIKHYLPTPIIIHLVGTNAKGTTGRFLAQALLQNNYTVGHYTSPHIFDFSERIWINGKNIDKTSLQESFTFLQSILTKEQSKALSYFEYTTLLAMIAFKKCQYVVLEAGLGGEKDATAVFDSYLTIATPIDFDHQEFLGNDIQTIARTKLNAAKKRLLLAKQPHKEVYNVALEIQQQKQIQLYKVEDFPYDTSSIAKKLSLAPYLEENLQTAIAALQILQQPIPTISQPQLFGRLTKIAPNILIDVGHNPLAAKAIKETLYPHKYTLIYNSFGDKNYNKIIKILLPIIQNVEILPINNERIAKLGSLQKTLTKYKLEYSIHKKIDPKKNYLVFGSFVVIEEFLKKFYEKPFYNNNH